MDLEIANKFKRWTKIFLTSAILTFLICVLPFLYSLVITIYCSFKGCNTDGGAYIVGFLIFSAPLAIVALFYLKLAINTYKDQLTDNWKKVRLFSLVFLVLTLIIAYVLKSVYLGFIPVLAFLSGTLLLRPKVD